MRKILLKPRTVAVAVILIISILICPFGLFKVQAAAPQKVPTPVSLSAKGYAAYVYIKWKAQTGVNGYTVYRSNSKSGTYTAVKSLTNTIFYFCDEAVHSNTVYYYKIKAYKVIGTTKIYSSFSAVVSAKTYRFSEAKDFSDGAAWVKIDNSWAAIDKKGKVLFKLEAGAVPDSDFHNGVATVKRKDGTLEMINKNGIVVTSPKKGQYDKILSFDNDLGMVIVYKKIDTWQTSEEQYGIINNKGQWQVELSKDNPFGYCRYMGNGIYASIPGDGFGDAHYFNVITKQRYDTHIGDIGFQTSTFDNNYCIFGEKYSVYSMDSDFSTNEILKNTSGMTCKIGPLKDGLFYISDGLLSAEDRNGFYNIKGDQVIDMSSYRLAGDWNYYNALAFSEGYCALKLLNKGSTTYYTVIDKTGKIMFEPVKDPGYGPLKISCGLIRLYRTGVGTSFINTSGKTVIPEIKAYIIYDFKDDLARVESLDNEIYYIDKTGKRAF